MIHCKGGNVMDKMPKDVPYIVHEDAMVRNERLVKRLVISLVISIVLMFVTNLVWIYWWNQYDTVSYDQNGAGINNINTGGQGDVLNEPTVKDTDKEEPKESKRGKGSEE